MALSVGLTFWLAFTLFFPSHFEPVQLDTKEEQALERKPERLNRVSVRALKEGATTPEPYS